MKWLIFVLILSAVACMAPTVPTLVAVPSGTPEPTATSLVAVPTNTATRQISATVTAFEALRVRQRPSDAALMMAVDSYLRKGDTVTLTGVCKSGWAQILWKDSTAWVSARYLSDNKCKE